MNLFKTAGKKVITIMGICFLTGSFCACGDDTEVSILPANGRTEPIILVGEPIAEVVTDTVTAESETENTEGIGSASAETGSSEDTATESNVVESTEADGDVAESTEADEAESNVTESDEEISITISAVGDVTLGGYPEQGYWSSLAQAYDEAEDSGYFFENVYDIFSEDDMTLVNLEGVLTSSTDRRAGQTYSIKGDPEYVDILTAGSIEAASMANNHRLDYNEEGCDDTVALLEENQIVYAYDENVAVYETKGIRIGIVSVNELSQGVAVENIMQEGIEKLKAEKADIIIACCHWGEEKSYYPENYQTVLGRKCIDWGADLVLGHHPHVLQGIEEYQGKYIVYSLGNFCFGANRNPDDMDTMIFQQTFKFVGGEKQEDSQIQVIPCTVSSVSTRNDFKPTPATGDEAARIIGKINDGSKAYGVVFGEDGKPVQ